MSQSANKGMKPSPGNGGSGRNYTWTQTLAEVSVVLNVPASTTARQINCTISDSSITLKVEQQTLLSGLFSNAVRADECFWQLDREDCTVSIHLEKADTLNWWSCVVKGHDTIDVSQIQPDDSRLDDLDGETRGMVEKMMYDQRQKAAGLPTSEEQQKLKLFENFKKQHPEMDFSQAKLQ